MNERNEMKRTPGSEHPHYIALRIQVQRTLRLIRLFAGGIHGQGIASQSVRRSLSCVNFGPLIRFVLEARMNGGGVVWNDEESV